MGAVFVAVTLFLVAVVAPLCACLSWVAQLMLTPAPATSGGSSLLRGVRWLAEVSHTQTALDVLWVTALISVHEMTLVAKWIVDDKFGAECALLERLTGEECITVHGELKAGWWLLGGASLTHLVCFLMSKLGSGHWRAP